MKRNLLKSIAQIKKVAEATGMTGQVSLHVSGIHPDQWDTVLASITEYKVWRQYVQINDKFSIALLLD